MKMHHVFNGLEILRYNATYTYNASIQAWCIDRGSDNANMNPTYQELIEHHKSVLSDTTDGVKSAGGTQVFRNQLSSLHSYLVFAGKTIDSRIGRELTVDFDARVRAYLVSIQVSDKSRSDRKGHLKAWKRAAQVLLAQSRQKGTRPAQVPGDTEFHRLLRSAFATLADNPMNIARKAGADEQAVRRWLKGAIPNPRTYPSLRRLERALGLPADALRQLVPTQNKIHVSAAPRTKSPEISYRQRLKQNVTDEYRLGIECLSPSFMAEWQSLFDYKTVRRPTLCRSDKGTWRLLAKEKIGSTLPPWAIKGELGCPTAELIFQQLQYYFGFLARPTAAGGLGVPVNELQTLAWLAVPEAINAFLEFRAARAGGVVHGGHQKFCSLVSSLTRADTGFLTQQPAFASRLPAQYSNRPWNETCHATYELCKDWKREVNEKSRNPLDPIRPLLDLAEPFAPILRAISDLDAAAATAPPGSVSEALRKRDALLLSMLIANPLRRRNYVQMTWHDDNTGALYQRQDGQWRIRFTTASDFKNGGRASSAHYDAPLPRALDERINSYIDEYRPRLIMKSPDSPWVFPNRQGEAWEGLSRQVEKLTRRLVPETQGFGTQAFRHIVATDYLRKNPNDYPTVALLLHDRLETVLAEYAHLRQDDSFGRYEQHLLNVHDASSDKKA